MKLSYHRLISPSVQSLTRLEGIELVRANPSCFGSQQHSFGSFEPILDCFWACAIRKQTNYISLSKQIATNKWAPVKTSDILEQLHQDIDTWYYPETLRNDRGDTKNDGLWYTCLPDFITNIESSGTMRDTQKTMTVSAMSFRGCDRFSPLLKWQLPPAWWCFLSCLVHGHFFLRLGFGRSCEFGALTMKCKQLADYNRFEICQVGCWQ